jgi:hypothetical protein
VWTAFISTVSAFCCRIDKHDNVTLQDRPLIAANITDTFKTNLIAWFCSASNGITDFFANRVIGNQLCAKKSDGTLECFTGDQLAAIAAGAATVSGNTGASGGSPAPGGTGASTATSTTSASLTVNGNNPASWPLNQIWNDNLGALFTHNGQSETWTCPGFVER